MILSDIGIMSELSTKKLVVNPILSLGQIHGCKIDVRLSNTLYLIKHIRRSRYDPMDESEEEMGEEFVVPYGDHQTSGFTLQPGEFATAPLFESVRLPPYLRGTLDGRSSLGRLGIGVHVTATTIDPGFSGQLACELANLGKIPVKLYPLQRVGSILLERLDQEAKYPYDKRKTKKYGSSVETKLATDYEFSKALFGKDQDGHDRKSIIEQIEKSL